MASWRERVCGGLGLASVLLGASAWAQLPSLKGVHCMLDGDYVRLSTFQQRVEDPYQSRRVVVTRHFEARITPMVHGQDANALVEVFYLIDGNQVLAWEWHFDTPLTRAQCNFTGRVRVSEPLYGKELMVACQWISEGVTP